MINIGIVDDHGIVRNGLRRFLTEYVDLRVTGEATNGRDALELVRAGNIDVLLLDLSMPGQGGVEALAAIKARFPDTRVLILSAFAEAHYATALLRQGASGYINKEADPEDIVKAIRVVAMGRRYISPVVAELLADNMASGNERPAHEALSARELQVFIRLAKGETIGDMAESMFLSIKTVSTYRTRVLEKLKLNTNSDLTHYALTNGLIQ
jgi:two-component system, NarL family, invasion response regulator UvrY